MARKADTEKTPWRYERRRPERALLYQPVAEHYPRFLALLGAQGRTLPDYVQSAVPCDRPAGSRCTPNAPWPSS